MSTTRTSKRLFLAAALLAGPALAAAGSLADDLKLPGRLSVAVYKEFPPFSDDGRGIDVELAGALAQRLGLAPDITAVNAREDMADDLRNNVWQGHYLNGRTVDVMMHVPVDPVLMTGNPQVHIFAPYQRENLAIARNILSVPRMPGPAGLEAFTREKVGVEGDTLADVYIMSAVGGRLKDHVVHFRSVPDAAAALKKGEVAAVMAPQAELEASLAGHGDNIAISPFADPGIARSGWQMGLAVKSGKPELQAALGRAMAALVADGTVARLFARHGVAYRKPE